MPYEARLEVYCTPSDATFEKPYIFDWMDYHKSTLLTRRPIAVTYGGPDDFELGEHRAACHQVASEFGPTLVSHGRRPLSSCELEVSIRRHHPRPNRG